MEPTSKEEIGNILSSLNSNKATSPNSISMQLADLLKLSFVIFTLVLKTAKVVPVFKKDPKLDYSNYRTASKIGGGFVIFLHLLTKLFLQVKFCGLHTNF